MWGPIIEKAFAKFHGNYARIEGGNLTDGVTTLNGGPSRHAWVMSWDEKTRLMSDDEIWQDL